MRQSDRDKLAARLTTLETRRQASGGARERLAARLALYHEALPPVTPGEAMARLVAGLAVAGDSPGIVGLRRAALRHV